MQDMKQFNSTRFNDLPEIEKADADVRSSGELAVALSVLGPIFVLGGQSKAAT